MMRLPMNFLALTLLAATSVTLAAQAPADGDATFGPVLLPPIAGMFGMLLDEIDAPVV
jgi:hypothetical protein